MPQYPDYVIRRMSQGQRAAQLARVNNHLAAGGLPHTVVNDLHSQLNATAVSGVEVVRSVADIQRVLREARAADRKVCVAGGRHAMGGQQFAAGGVMIDVCGMATVRHFDGERGLLEVEAGIMWPEVVGHLLREQAGASRQWGIAQKQTGADRLTIGGAVSANIHGRGLAMRPFISDVEALTVVMADGTVLRCSREENAELFRLIHGGYGLFGVVATVTLRLVPRLKLKRVVEVVTTDRLMERFDERIAAGHLYGDFQFAIDPTSPDFLGRGVFSTYVPVDAATPMPDARRELSDDDWRELLYLAHVRKSNAFAAYAAHYMATSGQLYWSDTHQLTTYLDRYHGEIDRRCGALAPATEAITELYVPRRHLADFLAEAAADFRAHGVDLVYGTVRLIERDDESVLPWARQPYACTIFNLHVEHTPEGRDAAAETFRRLIDMAIARHGSYYLTYHRHATAAQLLACHPALPEVLRLKRRYDPEERLESEWYRHHRAMLALRGS